MTKLAQAKRYLFLPCKLAARAIGAPMLKRVRVTGISTSGERGPTLPIVGRVGALSAFTRVFDALWRRGVVR